VGLVFTSSLVAVLSCIPSFCASKSSIGSQIRCFCRFSNADPVSKSEISLRFALISADSGCGLMLLADFARNHPKSSGCWPVHRTIFHRRRLYELSSFWYPVPTKILAKPYLERRHRRDYQKPTSCLLPTQGVPPDAAKFRSRQPRCQT
jgi:hypothetical protein